MIIAIDGPAASGKSTSARGVAQELKILYLDTGAMYRAVALAVINAGVDPSNESAVKQVLADITLRLETRNSKTHVFLNDEDVSELIRGVPVTQHVSAVSAMPSVRQKMVDLQREIVGQRDSVVEGRDIGTVVFPDADFKFYLTADWETRAERRKEDLAKLGVEQSVEEIVSDLKRRDGKDSGRRLSPLLKAKDAVVVDTSELTIDEQIQLIVNHVQRALEKGKKKGHL